MLSVHDLSSQELTYFQMEVEKRTKDVTVTWLLWLFTGIVGGHRYYLGNPGMGIGMTLTLGGHGNLGADRRISY